MRKKRIGRRSLVMPERKATRRGGEKKEWRDIKAGGRSARSSARVFRAERKEEQGQAWETAAGSEICDAREPAAAWRRGTGKGCPREKRFSD